MHKINIAIKQTCLLIYNIAYNGLIQLQILYKQYSYLCINSLISTFDRSLLFHVMYHDITQP